MLYCERSQSSSTSSASSADRRRFRGGAPAPPESLLAVPGSLSAGRILQQRQLSQPQRCRRSSNSGSSTTITIACGIVNARRMLGGARCARSPLMTAVEILNPSAGKFTIQTIAPCVTSSSLDSNAKRLAIRVGRCCTAAVDGAAAAAARSNCGGIIGCDVALGCRRIHLGGRGAVARGLSARIRRSSEGRSLCRGVRDA